MNRFDDVLKKLSDQLTVPHSQKPEIIAEVASDLESLYEHYCAQGMAEQEAEKVAIEKIIADSSVLEQFQSLNTPKILRLLERIPKRVRIMSEIILVMMIFAPLIVSGLMVITVPWLAERLFFWLLLIIAGPIFYYGSLIFFRFYIAVPYNISASRALLRKILWFGFLAVLIGFDGFLYEVLGIAVTIASMPTSEFSYKFLIEYSISGGNHISMGFLLGAIAVIVWVAGSGRLSRIEYHEDVVRRIIQTTGGME